MAQTLPNPVPIELTFKARFLGVKGYVTTHRELMVRDDLQRALDYALLEYQLQVARTTDMAMAGAGHYKMVGVAEFISVLKRLAETDKQQTPTRPPQIDHTA